MNKKSIGAALLLCFLAAVVSVFALHCNIYAVLMVFAFSLPLLGVVTVTYTDPVSGLTAPRKDQSAVVQSVTAIINFACGTAGDTGGAITHNFSLSVAKLLKLRPWITVLCMAGASAYPALQWALTDANSVTFTIGNNGVTLAGGTFNVVIQRPWTPLSTIDPVVP